MADFTDELTLREARELLRPLAREGHKCPLCTQFVKIYRRQINATMARNLIIAFQRHEYQPFHLAELDGRGDKREADFAKLRFWGLIHEEDERREDGGRAGYWRISALGSCWIYDETTVSRYALIFDNRLLGHEGEPWSVRQALGTKFDYAELMNA